MRAADFWTIDKLGIPGFTLMETAGRESARMAAEMLPVQARVLVLVGKGNNGGDGLVVARWLADAGHAVDVFLTAAAEDMSADASANLHILETLVRSGNASHVVIRATGSWSPEDVVNWQGNLLVDSLFGTGLESALRPPYDGFVTALNQHPAPVLALDVPSGLSATTGQAFEPCVRASHTVTMGALKAGHLLGDGPEVCGAVHTARIGIPAAVLSRRAGESGSAFLSSDAWVGALLPERSRADHKYTTGPTLIAGGSEAFPGAPALAARAAARIGSGYVVAAGPASIRNTLQEKLDAIPVASWSSDGSAAESVAALIDELGPRWDKARALLIGPGLGRDVDASERVWAMLSAFEGAVVLDADALFVLASDRDRVAQASNGRWILTPHAGELARLDAGAGSDANQIARVQRIAREWNCVVLAKAQPTITAHPDGRTMVNATGHPAAATAGSGDVLAGIVSGLLAQGLDPFDAAAAAIHIGGTAAGRFVERGASQSMVASDLVEILPEVLRHLS